MEEMEERMMVFIEEMKELSSNKSKELSSWLQLRFSECHPPSLPLPVCKALITIQRANNAYKTQVVTETVTNPNKLFES